MKLNGSEMNKKLEEVLRMMESVEDEGKKKQ